MYRLLATLLFCGLSRAATVFLNPPESLPSRLSPQQTNLILTAHLGLEQLEVVDQQGRLNHLFRERAFVGKGDQSALLLLVDQTYARGGWHKSFVSFASHLCVDIIPSTFKPSFTFSESNLDSLTSFIKTCNQRASHVYTYVVSEPSVPGEGIPRTLDIFSAPTPANEAFLAQMTTLVNYFDATPKFGRFAAFELTSVSELAVLYGRSSEQYKLATEALRAVVQVALADTSVYLSLMTYAPNMQKRSPLLSEQPVKSLVSCFSSLLECTDAMNDCSGHGECTNATRAGPSCFVCACTTTVNEAGRAENWAGERCERRDISGWVPRSCILRLSFH